MRILSLPRQLSNCEQAVARIGEEIVAHFYDVESGDSSFNARGASKGLKGFHIPIPRDGGLIDLSAGIFEWYATADLGLGEIAQRLNSKPERFPPPIPPDP